MESGRQTRRKASTQSSSFQTSATSKEKQTVSEKSNTLGSPILSTGNSSEDKTQDLKHKRRTDIINTENMNAAFMGLENPSDLHKHLSKSMNVHQGNDSKLGYSKRERKSSGSDLSDEISAETKKQFEMLFEIAQSLASKGDYHQAIHIYNKIVKLNDKSPSAWIAIGHCYAMLGDNYKALSSYQQALSITSDSQRDDQLWYGIGLLYQKTGDLKNAETSFKNALKLNPRSTLKGEMLFNLGTIMKAQGETKGAIRMLMNSITAGSFSIDKMVEVLCVVGQAQEEIDEVAEAMKTYKQALALDENNLKALQCAGWLSFQLERTNEALDYLIKASLIDEEDANIWFMQARCFMRFKQYNKAYDLLSKCIKKDQTNSTFWNSLGILFGEMQQLKSSHECFTNALKFGYSMAENYFNMGCLYELCSQFGDAIAMYDKAIELQPNFQLAYTRKLGAHFAQAENKEDTLSEVKFKHHKFTLALDKDPQKNKTPLPLPSNQNRGILTASNESDQSYLQREGVAHRQQKHQSPDLSSVSILQPLISGNDLTNAELSLLNSQFLAQTGKSNLQQFPFNQGLSDPVFAQTIKNQALDSLRGIGADYNLESLQNIKENNFNIQNDHIGNIKTSSKSSKMKGSKSSSKENFLKDNALADLQLYQNIKDDSINFNKSQTKGGFKPSQKSKEGDEEPLPQKKVKIDKISPNEGHSLGSNIQEVGNKRAPSLVLPSSLVTNCMEDIKI